MVRGEGGGSDVGREEGHSVRGWSFGDERVRVDMCMIYGNNDVVSRALGIFFN